MEEPPDIHAFPANRLGAFLRAMADPEGRGDLTPQQEQQIRGIEARVADSTESAGDAD